MTWAQSSPLGYPAELDFVARILRAFLGIDVHGHIPRVLQSQGAAAAVGHVGADEGRGVVELVHAGAPVVGIGPPQRRKHVAAFGQVVLHHRHAVAAAGLEHRDQVTFTHLPDLPLLVVVDRQQAVPRAGAGLAGGTGEKIAGLGINGSYIESFGQSLNGLSIGQTYTVSWQAANFGINNQDNSYLGSNAIGVMLDGASIGQGSTLSLSSNWSTQSLTFVATSASQLLSFSLASTEKAYLGIDGISVTLGGVAPAVPEPATWALMAIGLIGVGAMRRRQG